MIVRILVAAMCTVAVVSATLWFADAGIPSEVAVPVIVVALLAVRQAARHCAAH